MEPSYRSNKTINGNIGIEERNKAPLVGWTNHDSPNLSPAFGNTNKGISSPAKISLDTWSPTASSSEYLDGELTSKSDDPFASAETVPLREYPEKNHSDNEDDNEHSLLNPNGNSRAKIVSSNKTIDNGNNNETQAVRFEDESDYDDNVSDCTDDDGDSICSSSAEISTIGKPKTNYPDGGWGWMVVLSSFFISAIADGISFSFGLLFIKLLEAFGESTSKTAWIGSLFMAVPLLFGPIGSALVDRYGCRSMTIVGGIFSSLGFFLSAFSQSVEMMYVTFGFIAGLGLGLCYVTAVVSIAYWFDKKRTLATGLGACGTGFGTVVYAPMTQYFIDTYGWRGTIILLAGTFLNMCVWGAMMRDPEWWTAEQLAKHNSSSCASLSMRSEGGKTSLGEASEKNDFPGVEEIKRRLLAKKTEYTMTGVATMTPGGALHLDAEKLTAAASDSDPKKLQNCHSVLNLPSFVKQSEKVPLEVLQTLSTNNRWFKVILENYPSLLLCRSLSESGRLASLTGETEKIHVVPATTPYTPSTPTTSPSSPPVLMSMRLERVPEIPNEKPALPALQNNISNGAPNPRLRSSLNKRPKPEGSFKKQITSGCMPVSASPHYLKNIRVHRNSVMYRGAILNIHPYRLRASSCPDIFRNSMTTIAKETEEKWYTDILELFKGMVDFSMFLELHFLLMSLSTILLFTWFIVPYFYLADFMKSYKFTEAAASQILSIIGILNTIGMVGLGWAGDQPWMNVSKSYCFCLIMCGFATLSMPLVAHNFYLIALCGAFFGLFFASTFSFTPVILVQLVPIDRFTTGYGLILMCQGIGNLTGPPLAGLIYDLTGIWDCSFYLAGVNIILSGVLIAIIPMTKNRIIWGTGTLEKDAEKEADNAV